MNVSQRANDAEGWAIDAYGKAEDLTLRPIERPEPTGTRILVAVEAASLNPLDLKLMSGLMAKFMPVPFPFVPGSDVCGTVAAVGADVTALRVGDRVVAMTAAHGAMATHVLCDSASAVVKAPRSAAAADLASLPEAGMTALQVLREAGLRPGQTVAVIGATGGVGLMLCQLARRAGARVIATARSDDERLVRANGADETIHYAADDAVDTLRARHPDGVDVSIDLVHQFDGLFASARAVRRGGRLVSTLMGPEAGAFEGGVEVRYVRLAPAAEDLRQLVDAMVDGVLKANVTGRFAFSNVPQAYVALRDGHARGKLVVERG